MKTREEFLSMMAEVTATAKERTAYAENLAAPGKSVRLTHKDGRSAVCGPGIAIDEEPRVTFFDQAGPSGHMCYHSLAAAISAALLMGFQP